MKKKYYITPFDFFYTKNEKLGKKFVKSAYDADFFGEESEKYDLITTLKMIVKGFEENEKEFSKNYISIHELLFAVLKREF